MIALNPQPSSCSNRFLPNPPLIDYMKHTLAHTHTHTRVEKNAQSLSNAGKIHAITHITNVCYCADLGAKGH